MVNANLLQPRQGTHDNPRLEFCDGQYLFVMTNAEGGHVERFVSDAAVREAFAGVAVDSGWFNEEAASPAVCRWGDGRAGQWAVLYVPPGVHELEVTNDGSGKPYAVARVRAPLPALAFFGMGTNYYVFAMKTPRLDPHQELYRCPLPNVYASGEVCWGLLKPPRATARSVFDAWRLFVGSTFNNHMAGAKSKRSREDVRAVLLDMARSPGEAHYPVADLVRQVEDGGMTLDRAVREFFETGEMPG